MPANILQHLALRGAEISQFNFIFYHDWKLALKAFHSELPIVSLKKTAGKLPPCFNNF